MLLFIGWLIGEREGGWIPPLQGVQIIQAAWPFNTLLFVFLLTLSIHFISGLCWSSLSCIFLREALIVMNQH